VYLGDFGIVIKYKTEDIKPDKKCANNDTLNNIALDGHIKSNNYIILVSFLIIQFFYYIYYTFYKNCTYFVVHNRQGDLKSLM